MLGNAASVGAGNVESAVLTNGSLNFQLPTVKEIEIPRKLPGMSDQTGCPEPSFPKPEVVG